MSKYYDRAGQPMEMMEWAARFEDTDYKRVAVDTIGGLTVSTVWLGLDHALGGDLPLIFETMVFDGDGEPSWRYSTEEAALAGHAKVVDWLREGDYVDDLNLAAALGQERES